MQPIGNLYFPSLANELESGNWIQRGGNIGYAVRNLKQNPERYAQVAEQMLTIESQENSEKGRSAKYLLGLLYLQGQDRVAEAIELFRGSDTSHSNHALGVLYLQGLRDVPRDLAAGMRFLKRASEQGNGLASIILGIIHWTGAEGQARDSNQAQNYLKSFVHAYSTFPNLSHLSVESKRAVVDYALEKSTEHAGLWIQTLPEGEQPDAYRRQGDRLWSQGNNKEYAVRVWATMEKAIPKNRPLTDQEKGALCQAGRAWYHRGTKTDYREAVRHWKRAAEADHPMAHYYLGLAYCSGNGVKKDVAKGKAELKRAAEQQFLPAQAMLNRLEKKDLKPLQPVAENPLKLPSTEEKDVIQANNHFLGKCWTWIKNHRVCISVTLITIVGIAALLAGLGALTIFFPHVMVPIWVVAGAIVLGGGFFMLLFAAGSGDKSAQRILFRR